MEQQPQLSGPRARHGFHGAVHRPQQLARPGLADSLAFWTVSDIFEENRLGDAPFHGGFGLVNASRSRRRPTTVTGSVTLGSRELASGENYAATVRDDGALAVLLWNYRHYRAAVTLARTTPPDFGRAGHWRGLRAVRARGTEHFRLRVSGMSGASGTDHPVRPRARQRLRRLARYRGTLAHPARRPRVLRHAWNRRSDRVRTRSRRAVRVLGCGGAAWVTLIELSCPGSAAKLTDAIELF